jgi:subtilisin-like proprotein convertase family protein
MIHRLVGTLVVCAAITLVACGPSPRKGPGDGTGVDSGNGSGSQGGGCTPTNEDTPAACSDQYDNNCNGVVDCADPSCSGIGNCPVCGMVEHPTGNPVQLPDGIIGNSCTTSATCAPATPNCVELECHASYTSKLNFMGFGSTQKVMAASDFVSVCVNISHEWSRDVEISLQAPSGELIRLQKFLGRTGAEVYLGHPTDTDLDPGGTNTEQGADYCWTPAATKPAMLDYVNANGAMLSYNGHPELPPDNYSSADPWSMMIGAMLNGDWTIVVTDLWPIDAGVIHKWSIAFNPMIVQDCSGPVIQ